MCELFVHVPRDWIVHCYTCDVVCLPLPNDWNVFYFFRIFFWRVSEPIGLLKKNNSRSDRLGSSFICIVRYDWNVHFFFEIAESG